MARVEKTVFISYRRSNVPWALAVFQDLSHHGFDVFFDYQGLASGDFEQVILDNIKSRAHFLVLLTPSALERCSESGDWLRREIEEAIDCRRNIVPMMLESFNFGAPGIGSQLTGKLASLKRYNGLGVPPEYFDAAMIKLRERFLNVPLDAVSHSPSEVSKDVARMEQKAAAAAPPVQMKELTAQDWFERAYGAVDIEEKLQGYDEAIRQNPNFAGAYYNRGLVWKTKGDMARALKDFDNAIRLKPDDAAAYNNRGVMQRANGDLTGALKDFDEAIRLNPDGAAAYSSRGVARSVKGDQAGALNDLDHAIRLKPDFAAAFYNRAIVRKAKGDLAGALQDYDEAIRLNPDDAASYRNRANLRAAMDDPAGCTADLLEELRLTGSIL